MDNFFPVGERFLSWDAVMERKSELEKSLFIQLYQRDSKTLKSGEKHAPNRTANANADVKYLHVKMCCHSNGRTYQPKGNGELQSK